MEEMLTPQQAADYLKVSIYVIRRHLYQTHKLEPDARTRTGELRFSKKTLNALKPIIGRRGRVKGTVTRAK